MLDSAPDIAFDYASDPAFAGAARARVTPRAAREAVREFIRIGRRPTCLDRAPDAIESLRQRIRHVIAAGTPAQRKELVEAMVAEIRIAGDTVYPILRLPQEDPADERSTEAEGSPFRTMVRSGDRTGLEPGDRMWQNPNRIPAAQGPVVTVSAVRRRLS